MVEIHRVTDTRCEDCPCRIGQSCNTWQSIETAPKDGTRILACITDHWQPSIVYCTDIIRTIGDEDRPYRGFVFDGSYASAFEEVDEIEITHWIPLPRPPAKIKV